MSALVGTPIASGSLRQKRQARELFLDCFGWVVILWGNMRCRRGAGDAGQTCHGGGGRRWTDTRAEAVQGQTEERVTNRRRLSKGKPAIWGPGFLSRPPLSSPQPPPPPQAPGRPFCRPERVQVASCAAARPGQGQTALLLPSDGVPQPVASPRLRGRGGVGGGRTETAAASFVDVAWQPWWRCWATPADCSLS